MKQLPKLFISAYGRDRIAGSIWVVAVVFKSRCTSQSEVSTDTSSLLQLNKTQLKAALLLLQLNSNLFSLLDKKDIKELVEPLCIIAQPIDSNCSFQSRLPIAAIVADTVANVAARIQADFGECELVYTDLSTGNLSVNFCKEDVRSKSSLIVLNLAKLYYDSEIEDLSKAHSKYRFRSGLGHQGQDLAVDILKQGPLPCIRSDYLKLMPLYWLDLLRLGDPWAYSQCWLEEPPEWWTVRFKVPWVHWLTNNQLQEVFRLLKINGKYSMRLALTGIVEHKPGCEG